MRMNLKEKTAAANWLYATKWFTVQKMRMLFTLAKVRRRKIKNRIVAWKEKNR